MLPKEDLKLLLLIRHFETLLLDLFSEGKLNGTTHTCLGQEYIPVSLKPFFQDQDYFFSNHRGHGHYLTRFNDPKGLLAEIMGKKGAICNGVGGSQHIKRGHYMSTGVQGESVAISAGVGLSIKSQSDGIVWCFIGDGTFGEGIVYEALNFISLHKLPVIIIVENNKIAQTTPIELNMAGTIQARVESFDLSHILITGNDIESIRQLLADEIEQVRMCRQGLIIEYDTERLGPHSKSDDTRSKELLDNIHKFDWFDKYKHESDFDQIEQEVKTELAEILQLVQTSEWA